MEKQIKENFEYIRELKQNRDELVLFLRENKGKISMKEYNEGCKSLAELNKMIIESEKELDSEELIKKSKAYAKRKDFWENVLKFATLGVTTLGIFVPLIFEANLFRQGLEFEKEGVVSSGFFQRFLSSSRILSHKKVS